MAEHKAQELILLPDFATSQQDPQSLLQYHLDRGSWTDPHFE